MTVQSGRVLTPTGNGIDTAWHLPPMTTGGTVELDSLHVQTEPEVADES